MTLKVPAAGTHGARIPSKRVVRAINNATIVAYRALRKPGSKRSSLLLTTVGARTGQQRTVALAAFPDGPDRWLVIASLGGAAKHPAWIYNLAKSPDRVWVELGKEKFKVTPEILEDEERARVWPMITSKAPSFGRYQEQTDRQLPVVRLTREQGRVQKVAID